MRVVTSGEMELAIPCLNVLEGNVDNGLGTVNAVVGDKEHTSAKRIFFL